MLVERNYKNACVVALCGDSVTSHLTH